LKCFVRLLMNRSSASWRWWMFRVTKHQQNDNQWACRHPWDDLWSLPGDQNRKFKHVPHCHKVCSLTLDKWSKAAGPNVSSATTQGYRGPYSPGLACDFTYVLKQVLIFRENCKRYSTALMKMTSMVLLKHGKKQQHRSICSQRDYFEGDGSQNWVSFSLGSFW
jgi:hypothetical protein